MKCPKCSKTMKAIANPDPEERHYYCSDCKKSFSFHAGIEPIEFNKADTKKYKKMWGLKR